MVKEVATLPDVAQKLDDILAAQRHDVSDNPNGVEGYERTKKSFAHMAVVMASEPTGDDGLLDGVKCSERAVRRRGIVDAARNEKRLACA